MKKDLFNSQFYLDNLQEYNDPIQYDLENTWAADDDIYIELVLEFGGPVLDIGCGTGRLTRAIATLGYEIIGLDITERMLKRAKLLSKDLNITWLKADGRSFQLNKTFRVVLLTSHVFQHLLTDEDQIKLFKNIHAHLEKDGLLAFDTRGLAYKLNEPDQIKSKFRKLTNTNSEEITITYKTLPFDKINQLEHYHIERTNEVTGNISSSEIYLKYTSQTQLNDRLTACGFEVIHQYGDWKKNPYHSTSKELLTICKKI